MPGVSRSGATISAGLLRGLDRVAATRLSFFLLASPPSAAAGLYELKDVPIGTATSASARPWSAPWSASWWPTRRSPGCCKFVAGHSITWFVPYRLVLGFAVLGLLATGVITAT